MSTNGKLYSGCWMTEEVTKALDAKCEKLGLRSREAGVRTACCEWLGVKVEDALPAKTPKAAKTSATPKTTQPKAETSAKGQETAKKQPPKATVPKAEKGSDLSDLKDLEDDDEDDELEDEEDDDDQEDDDDDEEVPVMPKAPTPRRDASPAKIAEKRKESNEEKPPVKVRRPMPNTSGIIRPIEKKAAKAD